MRCFKMEKENHQNCFSACSFSACNLGAKKKAGKKSTVFTVLSKLNLIFSIKGIKVFDYCVITLTKRTNLTLNAVEDWFISAFKKKFFSARRIKEDEKRYKICNKDQMFLTLRRIFWFIYSKLLYTVLVFEATSTWLGF